MPFNVQQTDIPGVLLFQPAVFPDPRGFFRETYHQQRYTQHGLNATFVQDNHSRSARHVLRGLHFQLRHPQGKLVSVMSGQIFDVAVDIRRRSPTFGKWIGVTLSDTNHHQLWIPPGFAHGFCVLSETADVLYKCTDFYVPHDDGGILWSDPTLNIAWPIADPILSEKDQQYPCLANLPPDQCPLYHPS